ncbi:hypothetical protein VIOR3934_12390 [Vibrio orientalis CIP 102891 = ATCC 33934]|uniref:Uncharacterized protein n=1 Tax=Vibrio orientalis CIP 102891 = ATCC 33934 TaxID=675816 RepID=C9QI92_VIBOR|nr:hypothetical protein [Vibrio orientalis]EEX92531.1 hypothetical protein VIA_003176 [Vibrio orientalis CIP 102891 = ATCC 33934]EGU48540.1 hypothetical protein VIOR3934_12390 [Vibrio orientalis CIP 102891 = ATCC 33934]
MKIHPSVHLLSTFFSAGVTASVENQITCPTTGTDELVDIEKITFSDKTIAL